ncbi:MAG: SIR2 family protein [Deltaproteobacteria bacterium]|nr:SIR2 family protein [Deltaproteobacteria bacterium]
MNVGPSAKRNTWYDFFFNRQRWTQEEFRELLSSEEPGVAVFEVETYINGIMRMWRSLGSDKKSFAHKTQWISSNAEHIRRNLGWRQREIDLGLLRLIRRSSSLSVVVGAGATIAAGGPAWPKLVKQLIQIALDKGHEITKMVPSPNNTEKKQSFTRKVIDTKHFDEATALNVKQILAQIDSGEADTETLMKGAQICHDLYGQHLFTHMTKLLYSAAKKPSPIHRAIAELAKPQFVRDRGGEFSGWDSIITYNFDDLIGEAIDDAGYARAAFAMRGDEIAGDPNSLAIQQGQEGLYQRIYHLHGYIPRKPFDITKVKFVFSTSQYQKNYGPEQPTILNMVLAGWLANPVHICFYVGCSFEDEAMNDLLRKAASKLPGRYHFALLEWQGSSKYTQSSQKEIDIANERFHSMGVRPIWFDEFEEIPAMIRELS